MSVLQATLESTADGILVVDLDGRVVSQNRRFAEMWAIPPALIASKQDDRLIQHVQQQLTNPRQFVDKIRELYETPTSESFDVLAVNDGRVYERYSIPLRLNGRAVGRVWSFRDVTARRRAECVQEAVYRISHTAHTADNLQALLRAIHEIVGELMPAKNFYVSLYNADDDRLEFPYFVDEYDTARDIPPRKLRKGLTEYVLRTGQPLLATPAVYERLVAEGEAELIGAPSIDWLGVPLTVKDRTIGVVVTQTYSQGVRYGPSELDILTFVSSQMAMAIERKRVEDAWREQSELLQRIVDNIPVMLVFLDEHGRIQWGNREWTRTLGYEIAEARERDIFAELYPDPADQQRVRDSVGAPVGQWTDFRTRTRQGAVVDTIWANAALTGGGWLAIGMDVSDRRRAEERYRSFIAQSSEASPVSRSILPSRSTCRRTSRSTGCTAARGSPSATTPWRGCTATVKRASSSARCSRICTMSTIRPIASRSGPSFARDTAWRTPRHASMPRTASRVSSLITSSASSRTGRSFACGGRSAT